MGAFIVSLKALEVPWGWGLEGVMGGGAMGCHGSALGALV